MKVISRNQVHAWCVFNVLHSVQWYLVVDCHHDYHTTLLVDRLLHDYVYVIVKLQAQWYIDFIMKLRPVSLI